MPTFSFEQTSQQRSGVGSGILSQQRVQHESVDRCDSVACRGPVLACGNGQVHESLTCVLHPSSQRGLMEGEEHEFVARAGERRADSGEASYEVPEIFPRDGLFELEEALHQALVEAVEGAKMVTQTAVRHGSGLLGRSKRACTGSVAPQQLQTGVQESYRG